VAKQPADRARILVADDHALVLGRTISLLGPTFDVVGSVDNGRDLVAEAQRLEPDVIVLDITMPELTGIDAAHRLHELGSAAKLVFLTVHERKAFVRACMAEGAMGYVLKSRVSTDLIPAIEAALAGRQFVSSM
jgi:DNA-binding NarL/FixJ family response regulator